MIPTDNHEPRNGARVRLVVLHTSEGATDVASLGHFFQTVNDRSYHAAFDDNRLEQYVPYSEAAWAVLSANMYSDNGCFCCSAVSAGWTRADWLAHPHMLYLASVWVAERCTMRRLPIKRLNIAETAAACRDPGHPGGVIMHHDYTQATGSGTHTDCGDALPWDVIISRAQQIAGGQPPAKNRKEHTDMIQLPATPMPTKIDSDPKGWTQRNFDIPWNIAGGWEGGAAFSFGGQDWPGRTDNARVFLALASWVMPGGKLAPVNAGLAVGGGGLVLGPHTLTGEFAAPAGCVGVTLNYAAPGGAYVALGRSA